MTVILFLLAVLSLRAEDFNWSWEKDPKAPAVSEKPDAGSRQPAAAVSESVPVASTPAATDVKQPAPDVIPEPVVSGAGGPSPATVPAPELAGRKPVSEADDNFLWVWENDATNGVKGKGTRAARSREPLKSIQSEKVESPEGPSEIADLSGGMPKEGKPVEVTSPVLVESVKAPEPQKTVLDEPKPVAEAQPPQVSSNEGTAVQPQPVPVAPVDGPVAELAKSLAVTSPQAQDSGRVDAKAYDELIKENLDLHKKISETMQGKDMVKLENERLAREVKDLEQKISDSVSRIKDLARQKDASVVVPARLKDLEARLEKAEQEKTALGMQLVGLQKKISAQGRQPAAPVSEAAVRRSGEVEKPGEPVKAGSDLYVKLERENMLLKQKLGDIEAERQKAVRAKEETEKKERLAAEEARRALESQKQMKEKLEEVKSVEKKQKRLMVDLADRIPDMEKEMTVLQKKLLEKDAALKEKERHLEVLANEVEQRENRIRKAEKMVDLMEQAQKDVNQVSDSEKRDMHYNMAAVYSQVGRYADAEREYLHALRLDPADADVHYNLGILYDENLNDKPKAAMHYRRYLKLRPNGPDVDAVKNWLINIDMK